MVALPARGRLLCAALAAFVLVAFGSANAQSLAPSPRAAGISIELNKLEPAGPACRGYFVVANRTPDTLRELRTEVFLFDRAGVILRRLSLGFQDVRPERTKVVLFEFPDLACPDIGRLLVNDVLACTGAGGAAVAECGSQLGVSTRAPGVEFQY